MKRLYEKILFLCVFLVMVGGGYFVVMERGGTQKESANSGRDTSILVGVEIVQFSQKGPSWKATVERAVSDYSVSTFKAQGISIYWPENNLTVLAPQGLLDTKDMKIVLEGDVRAKSGPLKIEAPVFERDPETNQIHARGGIKVTGKGYTIKADEGSVKEDGVFEVRGNVSAVFGD